MGVGRASSLATVRFGWNPNQDGVRDSVPRHDNADDDHTYDSTLIAVVPSPGVRVTVAESLTRDLGKVSEWCDL